MGKLFLCLAIIFLFGNAHSTSEVNEYDPVIKGKRHNKKGIPVFRGEIAENEKEVHLEYPLHAYDNDREGGAQFICGYRLLNRRSSLPFTIEILDRKSGNAAIRLQEGRQLQAQSNPRYKMAVQAYDCGTPERSSNKALIYIKVKDADNFAPSFGRESFFVEMEEKKMYSNLITVTATDQDGTGRNGRICKYEILTPNVPFDISAEGVISNTEEVHYNQRHNFILEVVAEDCGGKRSPIAYVNVKMLEECQSAWTGIPEHINYDAGSGQHKLLPGAKIRWCNSSCEPDSVRVRIHLATKHIGKGCDRDTYSITSQRKLCGASDESVDLLPNPSLATSYTAALPTDDGQESDQIYFFDGQTNAVEVPSNHLNHSLHQHFTISMWMKHEQGETTVAPDSRPKKEHILCMSDGDHMSRHHYALFVHGEKLIFLLRRDPKEGEDMEVFKPAEWRWHIPQINDGEWHFYAISTDFPNVRLYIDGKLLIPDNSNLEILDDWPLQRSHRVQTTKLVVGACWQGSKSTFEHYFHGYLAGLSLLKDHTESDRVIHCLNSCKENLDFHSTNAMTSGSAVSFNSEMTEFTISGNNMTEIEKLTREIVYINSRQFPTPGRRNIDISTSIRCGTQETVLPVAETYIMVNPAPVPSITIEGQSMKQATIQSLREGIRLFEGLHINVDYNNNRGMKKDKNSPQETVSVGSEQFQQPDIMLDTCTVRADPPLDFHVERLSMPESMMVHYSMRLEGSETNSGLVINNADTRANYERVLQELFYYHSKGEDLSERKFFLSCSSQSGRFISNQLVLTVAAIHTDRSSSLHAHAQSGISGIHTLQLENGLSNAGTMGVVASASPNVGMIAIIVVCVGFLLFMIILGVIRIRAAHNRTHIVQVENEMEWDNSFSPNIVVNPMEQREVFEYEESPLKQQDDSDSDDDIDSYHEDGDTSEEEQEVMVKKVKDLEWDDSL